MDEPLAAETRALVASARVLLDELVEEAVDSWDPRSPEDAAGAPAAEPPAAASVPESKEAFSLEPAEKGFVIVPDRELKLGPWNEQGAPLYGGGVVYGQRFEVDGKSGRYHVLLPSAAWWGRRAAARSATATPPDPSRGHNMSAVWWD